MKQFENKLYYYFDYQNLSCIFIKIKIMNIELSLKELNDLYYCVSKVSMLNDKLLSSKVLDELSDKLVEEIVKRNILLDK